MSYIRILINGDAVLVEVVYDDLCGACLVHLHPSSRKGSLKNCLYLTKPDKRNSVLLRYLTNVFWTLWVPHSLRERRSWRQRAEFGRRKWVFSWRGNSLHALGCVLRFYWRPDQTAYGFTIALYG
jgi:hypothetical protein